MFIVILVQINKIHLEHYISELHTKKHFKQYPMNVFYCEPDQWVSHTSGNGALVC